MRIRIRNNVGENCSKTNVSKLFRTYDRKGKGRRGVGGGGGGQERGGKEERRYLTIGYLGELTRDQEETLTRSPLRECQNIHANVKR